LAASWSLIKTSTSFETIIIIMVIMVKFAAKNKRALRRAGLLTATASSITGVVRSQGTSAACAALYPY